MGAGSSIEWTNATWNPVTGCTKISQGCKNCYAERMAVRLQAMGQPNYRNGFRVTLQEHMLDLPLTWKKPKLVFVNSMSDLFHVKVPTDYIQRVFAVMERASNHTFQVLTKRADRLREIAGDLPWPDNVWMGVSVENEEVAWRIDELRQVPAAVRFLSLEPASTGRSSAASRATVRGRWTRSGSERSATSAGGHTCPSSSSSGAA
jgi:protein gp37